MQLRRNDEGVTLIELLMAIIILSIIIVPLSNALIVVMRNTDDINRRLNESHDIQIATAYFAQDVQNTGVRDWTSVGSQFTLKQSIELNAPYDSGLYFPCGSAGTPNAIVRFAWDDPSTATGTPGTFIASYVVVDSGTEHQLRRIACTPSGTNTVILVHNLVGTPAAPTCSSSCTATTPPQQVSLSITIKDPSSTGSAISLVLSGQRRQT
jgi:prepilin-type N-terminal cleavage/methylation domain-containing protein